MELNAQRTSNLSKRLYAALCKADLRIPQKDETEPHYTGEVLAPVVRSVIDELVGLPLQFRGDGSESRAVPASALEIAFYPDLAVSNGKQHLWAAEVKILKAANRQNAIATALGQATLYRSRYEHVVVVLIDTAPSTRQSQRLLVDSAKNLGVRVVIRPRVAKVLFTQAAR